MEKYCNFKNIYAVSTNIEMTDEHGIQNIITGFRTNYPACYPSFFQLKWYYVVITLCTVTGM